MQINTRGQTALVLILLSAAALIFLSITLNWGRIAQTKALLTIAADQSAALLASDAASYGEEQKQTYLKDKNRFTESTGLILFIIMIIVAIIVLVITITSGGSGFAIFLAAVSVVMAVANLVLQAVVVQPGITSLWNKAQSSQPIQQQFYEQGISTALQGAVTDQVKITDYFDWNADGIYGLNTSTNPPTPYETVSRFAAFYTDRLKMINAASPALNPQVVAFYQQLGFLMNGGCDDGSQCNNGKCTDGTTCFKLNDSCAGTDPGNAATYSPYCDPCCQPLTVPGSNPPKALRPSTCADQSVVPAECLTNNPYGNAYPFLYDPSFQNYDNTQSPPSFLDQFGRDQQLIPLGSTFPLTTMTPDAITPNLTAGGPPLVEFPNGIYPFFWLMKDYSPEVDNINPAQTALTPAQYHWCTATALPVGTIYAAPVPAYASQAGAQDLAQLSLPYVCSGQDCCVNYLSNPANGVIDIVGSPNPGPDPNPVLEPNSGFGDGAASPNLWLEADNQMCLMTSPYNGGGSYSSGTCDFTNSANQQPTSNPTIDSLDDTMHTLSDFVTFAKTFLGNSEGTLSSSFVTWYPQATTWIGGCDDGSTCGNGICSGDGSSCVGRLTPLLQNFTAWNTAITNWLNNNNYASSGAWCVPQTTTGFANEDNAITGNGTVGWGSLPSVINCLNYNSNPSNASPQTSSVYNYTQCLSYLNPNSCPAAGSSLSGTACDASILGRSLTGTPNPDANNTFDGNCNVSTAGSLANWASNSSTLAVNESPKFALRSAFLTDIYTKAQTMQSIFSPTSPSSAYNALYNFIIPPNSPSAQLIYAFQHQSTASLPNQVIYGWVDNPPIGSGGCTDPTTHNKVGCAHVVEVTAYSPGRGNGEVASLLPWIKTSCTSSFLGICLSRSYTLTARDGYVEVGIKRWDEDHNAVLFPNGHLLWQSLFHNPNGGSTITGQAGLPITCGSGQLLDNSNIGFGLDPNTTLKGLQAANIISPDATALGNAFMLDDPAIDPNEQGAGDCQTAVRILLSQGTESHACAKYVADVNANDDPSSYSAGDYSVKFVNCPGQVN